MSVFVTGATGHLGANLIRLLVKEGARVRVLVRSSSDRRALEGVPVEQVVGDLHDRARLEVAMQGCSQVYHLAAFVSLRRRDRDELHRSNVIGTRNVLEAAERAGVARVVHTSSFGALGVNPSGTCDAASTLSPFADVSDYERSKAFAELEVWRAAARGLDACIVNPSAMVGPWDFKPSLIGRTLLDFLNGRLPLFVHGAYDFVPVEAAARGLVAAMKAGKRGERYVLSGELVELAQIFAWLEGFTGRRHPRVGLPAAAVRPFVVLKDELEERLLPRRHPRFNAQSLQLLSSRKRGDRRHTEDALGWRPGSVREAFEVHVAWLLEHFGAPTRSSITRLLHFL